MKNTFEKMYGLLLFLRKRLLVLKALNMIAHKLLSFYSITIVSFTYYHICLNLFVLEPERMAAMVPRVLHMFKVIKKKKGQPKCRNLKFMYILYFKFDLYSKKDFKNASEKCFNET